MGSCKASCKKELISARNGAEAAAGEAAGDAEIFAAESLKQDAKATIKGENVKATVVDEEAVPVLIPEKKRLPEKVVQVGGINVFAGGDITDNVELLMAERDKNLDEGDIEEMQERIKAMEEQKQAQDVQPKGDAANTIIGKDLTSATSSFQPKSRQEKRLPVQGLTSKLAGIGGFFNRLLVGITEGNKMKKYIFGFILATCAFMAVAYFFFSSVSITLTFAENTVKLNSKITAGVSVTDIDPENLKIPGIELSKNSSMSEEASATGQGKKGDPAKGVVKIYNKTSKAVTIKAGTLITNINTNLKYKVVSDVTLNADEAKDDQAIEAETFGENYNITVKSVVTFSVAGYITDDVIAYGFRDVTGGTGQNIVVVSKEDIDSLKASLEEKLKKELLDALNTLISADDILLNGSEKFVTNEFTTSKKENEEADKFTADLKMSVTALKVTKSDLKSIAEEIARKESGIDNLSTIKVSDPLVSDIVVTEDGKNATFGIKSNAGVVSDVDENVIKEDIKGKSLDEAKSYLSEVPGLDEFKITYSPPFIPFFLQRIPSDPEKITVVKQAASEK